MSARSSRARSRRHTAPKAPGMRWWAYALLIGIALVAVALCYVALTHEYVPAGALMG